MQLLVAQCEVRYQGRLAAYLPKAVRLILFKADGSVLVHSDSGSYKPLNWMTAPTRISRCEEQITVTKPGGEEHLEITLFEILQEWECELDTGSALVKDGVEAELQQLLAQFPNWCGEGLKLVRREWMTDIGPVDLMCRDEEGSWVAVEVKRIATIDAVEQLTRYLDRLKSDPAFQQCRGVLVAQKIKPQAATLARSRGIECVEVELEVLKGEKEPELTLFS